MTALALVLVSLAAQADSDRFDPPAPDSDATETSSVSESPVTVGPTLAVYVNLGARRPETNGSFDRGGLGIQAGVRFFLERAQPLSVSLLGAAAFSTNGPELGLPLRVELVAREPGRMIPFLRGGLEARYFTATGGTMSPLRSPGPGTVENPGLQGTRLSVVLGWCLFARRWGSAVPSGGGGAGGLVALGLMTSELSAGLEWSTYASGRQRSGWHLAFGFGI